MICGLQDDLRQRHETLRSELKELREEKHRIEVELKRLVDMIAAGTTLPTVMSAIAECEARIRAIKDTLVEPGPDSLQEKLDGLRTFAVERALRSSVGFLRIRQRFMRRELCWLNRLESSHWRKFTTTGK
jgi:predicted  nucleic acid-binding Zn-ribbon protein